MIDFKLAKENAIKFAKSKGLNAEESCETENFYIFLPITNNGDGVANSSSIAVDKKSGKTDFKHFKELMNETFIKEY